MKRTTKLWNVLTVAGLLMLPLTGACSKSGGGDEGAGAFSSELDKLAEQLKTSKSKDNFTSVHDKCLSVMMDAAMKGQDIEKDKKYQDVCKVGYVKTQAEVAIAQSKPGKESPMCLGALVEVETLVEEKVAVDVMRPLAARLNQACGYDD